MDSPKLNLILTIGHSNHPMDKFITLLKQHTVGQVVDVRSEPYSRYSSHFNKAELEHHLMVEDIRYVFLGTELGARPHSSRYYDGNKVNFDKLVKGEEFQRGIRCLLEHISNERIALMCAEKDPLDCHRMIILSRYLKNHQVNIGHIHEDGTVEEHHQAELRLVRYLKIEPTLFEPDMTEEKLIERAYQKQQDNISFSIEATHKTHD
jgi:uncharacterized protein (DUF488 family)